MNLKVATSIVALLILPGISFGTPSFYKDAVPEGKAGRNSIEEICDSSHEPHPDRVGTPIQSADYNHGGFKKVGEANQQENLEFSPSRPVNEHKISAIEGRLMAKSETALSLHRDQDKFDTKQAEFDSMLQSFEETQAEIKQTFFIAANVPHEPAVQLTDPDRKTFVSVIEQLTVVHDYLLSIHGTPNTLSEKSPIAKTQSSVQLKALADNSVETYHQAVHDLFRLVLTPTNLPPAIHHIRLASNSCILQTLAYLRKYKLIPTDIEKSIEGTLKSPTGLEWIAREAQEAFVPGSRYNNNFHHPFHEVEFLENHPQLVQYSHLFKDLPKKEQDFVLFKGLKIGITNVFPHTHEKSGRDTVKISTAAKPYTNFMEKMETLLLKELEPGNHQKITAEDFSEVGKDILNIKNFLMDPVMVPENEAIVQNHFKRYSFLILDFLQRKLGSDYMEKVGLSMKEHNTEEFQTFFAFMKSSGQMELWRTMFMDYGWFVMQKTVFKRPVPPKVWEETSGFLWGKLMEEIPNYQRLSHGPEEKLQQNSYIHGLKLYWDYESRILGEYLKDFLAMAHRDKDDTSDLPLAYRYLYLTE
ncbi:hypothetical protein KEM48_001233 [Puccinia striiformis f. sp. tritici PST-130]|nr:hypothetical protein Pst134EB_031124 [Puccinia striiformis f. sp. tritici]KAI9601944.1 hypothetical protein KEM48_001233 [Puccinia striiformis f. sp. tritici PST-130]